MMSEKLCLDNIDVHPAILPQRRPPHGFTTRAKFEIGSKDSTLITTTTTTTTTNL